MGDITPCCGSVPGVRIIWWLIVPYRHRGAVIAANDSLCLCEGRGKTTTKKSFVTYTACIATLHIDVFNLSWNLKVKRTTSFVIATLGSRSSHDWQKSLLLKPLHLVSIHLSGLLSQVFMWSFFRCSDRRALSYHYFYSQRIIILSIHSYADDIGSLSIVDCVFLTHWMPPLPRPHCSR